MQSLIIALFILLCLVGCLKPMWALGMVVYINSMEQLLQTAIPYWATLGIGGQLVNYIVGIVCLIAVTLSAPAGGHMHAKNCPLPRRYNCTSRLENAVLLLFQGPKHQTIG